MGVGQGAVGVLKIRIKDYNEKTTIFFLKNQLNFRQLFYYLGEALVEFIVLIDFDFFGGSCPNGFSIINQVPIPCGLLNL